MKAFSKIKLVLNSVPKRTAAVMGLIAAVLVPLGLNAWGPGRTTFTMEKPATYVTFDSITDNPDVGSELNFARVSEQGQKGWSDTATMQEGKTYVARLYVHNNMAANLANNVATNVRAGINMPTGANVWGKQFDVNSFISADNANPKKIWDDIILKSDKAFHVKIVSQKYYNNVRTEKSNGFDLGNELFTSQGAQLGYNQMDGKIPGCLAYSGYVLVKFQPVFQEEPTKNPGYDVIKTVDKTSAKPGETINYTITVKNTGEVDLTDVKVTDQLPAYYSKAEEKVEAPSSISGSIVKGGAITFDKLKVGETAKIHISYTIKGEDQLECGEAKITNKAIGTTDQDQAEDSTSNNEVTTTVNKDCTPPPEEKNPGYDVIKTVDKTTAKPGEAINYTITVKNTGEVDLTNVKVTDQLPAYYSKAEEKIDAPSTITGSIVKGGQITIAKLPVGQSATIRISYTVKAADQLECGETKITNKATGTTDQDQTEDNTSNNEVTTTVNKDCTPPPEEKKPGYDLVKTVDKTSAKPGDTLTYTLTFNNTGETDLTNVVIKDKLPSTLTLTGDVKTEPSDGVSGNLFTDGLTIKEVKAGKSVKITFKAVVANSDQFQCGDTKLTNTASGTSKEDQTDANEANNSASTTITKECTPITPPNEKHNDNQTTPTPTPQSPTVIAQTGAGDVIMAVLGLGATAAAVTAYVRSRQLANK